MGQKLTRRSDIGLLLLLFLLNDGAIKGRKRIQKLVFLLKKHGVDFSFDFKPYFYGPYSEGLADTMNLMTGVGLLKERILTLESGFAQHSYTLTTEAKQLIKKSKFRIPRNFRQEVTTLSHMSTSELVRESKKIMS
jgi:uncharacterized protein YwgA